ncbi:hypothetical protein ACS0TY_031586 [Phlomoides rotata]
MAEVVISPLLQVLYEKLAPLILAKLQLGRDYKKDLEKLRSTLSLIQAVIEDAEVRQWKDKKVKLWLEELKSLAYEVDDVLDEFTTSLVPRKSKTKVRIACLSLTPLFSRYYLPPRKLKSIQERLNELVNKMSTFQFKEAGLLDRSDMLQRRETGPYVDESQVLGRSNELETLIDFVMCSSSCGVRVSALPVVGIGGMGKTTLAQLLYNDERVERKFDVRIWISVRQEFNVKKIMNEILDYTGKGRCESKQLGVLQTELLESLGGKRYILVLDDVWNEDVDEWEKLEYPLRNGAQGSKIIVTTRSIKVAAIVSGMASPYTLEALKDDDCWELFKKRAFLDGEEDEYPNLLEIGKQIVSKCRGVPLAAKIVGSCMRFKRVESEWWHVLKNEVWNVDRGEDGILSALRLSYNHLSSQLKRCFAYCAVFPKNFEMTRDKMIQFWIAQGLIQASSDTHSIRKMEDMGNEYFDEFLSLSLFQVVDIKDGIFGMHDLLHDLAIYVGGSEFLTAGGHQHVSQIRHAAVLECSSKSSFPEALRGARDLRSLRLYCPGDDSDATLSMVIRAFGRLRVLDLSDSGIKRLSKCIGRLIHLRYLDLSRTILRALPKAICKLSNLQTLNLTDCYSLQILPQRMKDMVNLRHLIITNCTRLARMPPSIRNLLNLQTLSFYIVGHSFEESLFQLVHLDFRGEIRIRRLENAIDVVPDLCLEQKQLHSLGLSWGDDDEEKCNGPLDHRVDHGCDDELLLKGLQPNAGLRKLYISGYTGINFPQWMNRNTTPNLREIVLKNCTRCEHLPPLGHLQFLEVLKVLGFNALKSVGDEFYGEGRDKTKFPCLKQLTFQNCPSLESWECQESPTNTFTCLDRLSIIGCPRLTTMPRLPHVRHLELRSCNARILRRAAELTSLSTLIIDVFPDLLYLPEGLLQNNSALESLTISSCPHLTSLPWDLRNLRALKSLTIRWCEELSALPQAIRNFTSLESLEITECPSLSSLPEEGIKGLCSLRSLSIENCCNLTSLPTSIMHLTTLERLTIMYCSSLSTLPDGLHHLSALRSLSIISCEEMSFLPHFNTLQNLEICSCPKLMELPDWVENLASLRSLKIYDCHGIKSLPAGLKRLNALQHLSIRDCPDLEQKCVKGKGINWGIISHVPYLYIGSSAPKLNLETVSSSSQ